MKTRSKSLVAYMLLALLSLMFHFPVIRHASQFRWDFGSHMERALRMPDTLDHISHPLSHAIFLLIHRLLGLEQQLSVIAAVLLVLVPVPLIAFALFKRYGANIFPTAY